MKRSEMYKLAQVAVVNSLSMDALVKLEVLQELMCEERLARLGEEGEEKK